MRQFGLVAGALLCTMILLEGGRAAQALTCPGNDGALLFSDTALAEGEVTRVQLQSDEEISLTDGRGRVVGKQRIRAFSAAIELRRTIRGNVEGALVGYEFRIPATSCSGPPVKEGHRVIVSLSPTYDASRRQVAVHTSQAYEAALAKGVRDSALRYRPSEDPK